MRKYVVALLAAATLVSPAAAQRGRDPGGGGMQPRGERTVAQPTQRQVAREGLRHAFGNRERAQGQREARRERREDRQAFRNERSDDRQDFRRERAQDRQALQQGDVTRREFRRDRAEDRRDFRQDRARDVREYRRDQVRRPGNVQRWNRDWRQDRRYDWQGWRQRNGGLYRLPRYVAPPSWGYGYRRFGLGVYLGAPLFGSSYWLNDPWSFRLPAAAWPYQWVRYYDDVLLVDTRTGYVVDAIYDFFW